MRLRPGVVVAAQVAVGRADVAGGPVDVILHRGVVHVGQDQVEILPDALGHGDALGELHVVGRYGRATDYIGLVFSILDRNAVGAALNGQPVHIGLVGEFLIEPGPPDGAVNPGAAGLVAQRTRRIVEDNLGSSVGLDDFEIRCLAVDGEGKDAFSIGAGVVLVDIETVTEPFAVLSADAAGPEPVDVAGTLNIIVWCHHLESGGETELDVSSLAESVVGLLVLIEDYSGLDAGLMESEDL